MQASGDLLESYTEGSASYLAQAAKEAAGPVRRAAEDCEELDDEFDSLKAEYKTHRINPAGDLSHEERKITEDMMAETKETIDAAEQAIAAAETMTKQTSWRGEGGHDGGRDVRADHAPDRRGEGGQAERLRRRPHGHAEGRHELQRVRAGLRRRGPEELGRLLLGDRVRHVPRPGAAVLPAQGHHGGHHVQLRLRGGPGEDVQRAGREEALPREEAPQAPPPPPPQEGPAQDGPQALCEEADSPRARADAVPPQHALRALGSAPQGEARPSASIRTD